MIISYATNGKRSEFAAKMGWTRQYLNNMLHGKSLAFQPVLSILREYPEISARWFLFGEGDMIGVSPAAIASLQAQVSELADIIEKMRGTMRVEQYEQAKKLQQNF